MTDTTLSTISLRIDESQRRFGLSKLIVNFTLAINTPFHEREDTLEEYRDRYAYKVEGHLFAQEPEADEPTRAEPDTFWFERTQVQPRMQCRRNFGSGSPLRCFRTNDITTTRRFHFALHDQPNDNEVLLSASTSMDIQTEILDVAKAEVFSFNDRSYTIKKPDAVFVRVHLVDENIGRHGRIISHKDSDIISDYFGATER